MLHNGRCWIRPTIAAIAFVSACAARPSLLRALIQEREYFSPSSNATLPFALFVPPSLKEALPAPLVIALHGLGDTPLHILRYPGLVDLAAEHGYIVVAPMGYSIRGWYGAPIPANKKVAGDPDDLPMRSEADVLDVITLVSSELRIDARRVYILGHSMGGGGAWHLALKLPGRFAAIAAIAPAPLIFRARTDVERLRNLPIILVQGSADRQIPPRGARQWARLLRSVGAPHRYLEIQGATHITAAHRGLPAIFAFFDRHPPRAVPKPKQSPTAEDMLRAALPADITTERL